MEPYGFYHPAPFPTASSNSIRTASFQSRSAKQRKERGIILSAIHPNSSHMITLELILYVLPLLTLSASITYYAMVLRIQNKTRQTQLFMNLYTQLRSKEFIRDTRELSSWQWSDFNDFRAKYGSRADKEANTLFYSTANFFDGVGVLVEHKELDPKLVEELMSSWVIWFWEKFGTIIKEYRNVSYPQYLEKVEFLYNKIKPLAAKEHPQFKA